jgi:putative ABC transport system permease protein
MVINIIGLAIGIACSVMISVYVIHEISYDHFNEKKDRIYRLNLFGKIGGQEVDIWATASVCGPTIVQDFPEVESFLRLNAAGGSVVKIGNISYVEDHMIEADSTFFDFFSIPLLRGDPKTVLNSPYSAVLSKRAAEKYFGDDDILGKTMKIGNDTTFFTVTGLMENVPDKSHIEAEVITSFMTNPGSRNPVWLNNNRSTYLMLNENTTAEAVMEKLPGLVETYVGPEVERFMGLSVQDFEDQGNAYGYYLQPLTKIHLNPDVENSFKQPKDPKSLLIFASIALLIIIIAGINYMNLSTAQASKRAREVGIKKVSGSTKGALVKQFVTESVLLSFVSLVLAVVIIEVSLPYFGNLLQLSLDINYFSNWYIIPGLLLLAILVGFISGIYPAFYLSSFRPVTVLKGSVQSGMRNGKLRKLLVIFQFAVSIILIVGTLIMYKQIHFMLNKDLGYEKKDLLVVTNLGALEDQGSAFKEVARQIPGVKSVALSTTVPGRNNNNNGYLLEGRAEESFLLFTNWADYDFLKTWGIKLAEGRFFEEERGTDQASCIINQAAVTEYQMEHPLKERFILPGNQEETVYSPVIGVIKDFHHESLHRPVAPYIIRFRTDDFQFGYAAFRIDPARTKEVISGVEDVWKDFTGNDPLQYFFADDDFNRLYREEKQNAQLAVVFSILAVLIGTMGLFGLTSYSLAQRTREIGIRRTMGASVSNIYILISSEIAILVSIATVISWTIIYFFLKNWLENFHYRIGLSPVDFILGFLVALAIALTTITYRTLKAARTNPAASLKYE